MSYSLKADSLALWRAARDAEPNGISREIAASLLNKQGQDLSDHLFRLTQARYITRVGEFPNSRWRIANRVPKGEALAASAAVPAPAPAPAPAPSPVAQASKARATGDDDDDDDLDVETRQPVTGVPPGVPNSVFALGAMSQLSDAATLPAFEGSATPAPASARVADLSSWKPAKPLVASPEPPAGKGWVERIYAEAADNADTAARHQELLAMVHRASKEAAQQPAPPAQGLPVFQLHSDGSFVIAYSDFPGHHVRLQPDATRAMFSFLDRIGGLDLTRLVTEPEATS